MNAQIYFRPVRFRGYTDADLEACLKIWRANEGNAFPAGYEAFFTGSLRTRESFYLVGEYEGEIVCCGGVNYHGTYADAVLSFGMVDPKHQRRGFGTTLLMARLALLHPPLFGGNVLMEATPHSLPFYRRFGFQSYSVYTDEAGLRLECLYLRVLRGDVQRCATELLQAGATLPEDYVLPVDSAWEKSPRREAEPVRLTPPLEPAFGEVQFQPIRWLFAEPRAPITVWRIICWWETRRFHYNVAIFVAGYVAHVILSLSISSAGVLETDEDAVEPFMLLLVPIAANLCYTGGCIVDALWRANQPTLSPRMTPLLYKIGLGFSSAVISLPALIWGGYCLLQICGVVG